MVQVDLSKVSAPRFLVYLLSLFPGLFFLVSVGLGNPQLAKTAIDRIYEVHHFPAYSFWFLLVGSGFVIGQAFVLLSWLIEVILAGVYRAPRAVFRKVLGGLWLYRWFGKFQGIPPRRTRTVRALGWLIFRARVGDADPEGARRARACLGAAAEKLLERRYGIDRNRGDQWGVWYQVLGRPVKVLVEGRNAGRVTVATGLAGFVALGLAPGLIERYYVGMCSVFVFCGLCTAAWFFFAWRDPVGREMLLLRGILQELRECAPGLPGREAARAERDEPVT